MEQSFKRSVNELQAIVAATGRFFSHSGTAESIRMAVDLAVEELFVNMVTYNLGTDHDILLQMQASPGGVTVSLTDYDVEPFDPSLAPHVDINAPLDQREPNGLGLYLVSKMVDSVHYAYRDRESKVTFVKTVRRADD
ncbi:MAG: ATP-binding protein [Rhodanobacter sp.]